MEVDGLIIRRKRKAASPARLSTPSKRQHRDGTDSLCQVQAAEPASLDPNGGLQEAPQAAPQAALQEAAQEAALATVSGLVDALAQPEVSCTPNKGMKHKAQPSTHMRAQISAQAPLLLLLVPHATCAPECCQPSVLTWHIYRT